MTLIDTTPTTYKFEGGVELPRVTSILSVVHRFDGINPDVLAHAAERGKAVHRAIWLLEGGTGGGLDRGSLHPEVAPYVESYEKTKRALGFEVICAEQLVFSNSFGAAGRVDLGIRWQGFHGILDIKTGAKHWSHRYQVSAYMGLSVMMFPRGPKLRRWILYLNDSGAMARLVDLDKESNQVKDFRGFCAIRDTYNLIRANGGTV